MSYHIVNLQKLGSGGNGDLFRGQRSDNGDRVVVKYLREHHLPHARRAFAREVRILSQRRRHIIPILFARLDAERPYYVMPFLAGGSLTQWAGRLTEGQLLTIALEIATALAGLHGAWICHGDIKPDNALVEQDGHLLVADPLGNGFGCTMLFSENCGGTPGYWAPEVRRGQPISRWGDVYSYGATMHHLLTGQKPQDGQRLDLSIAEFEGSAKIREIVGACCQLNPAARPKMNEVLRMLRGETWARIQEERKNLRDGLVAVGVAGGIVLGIGLLASVLEE
jgi:serine/threonine-protein kinase